MKPRPNQRKQKIYRTPTQSDRMFSQGAWDVSNATFLAGRAHTDGVEAVAIGMENKWGCGRLRLLVTPELREKFDRQRFKLASAIRNGDLEALRIECERTKLAWRTLDAHASSIDCQPLSRRVWEVTLKDGTVAAIVPDRECAGMVQPEGRKMVVFTLEEIANLITLHDFVLQAKLQWPGAEVMRVVKNVLDPLDLMRPTTLDDKLDDVFVNT
jgi:hypothetical protein